MTELDQEAVAVHGDSQVEPVAFAPTAALERVATIDILRGLALFGILAANMRGMSGPAGIYISPERLWPGFPDRLAQAVIDTFIQGKFITIFAFLFGAGFAIQLERAEARGAKFGSYYVRRLLLLALIGLVHGLLIWFGDILLVYAVTGLMLLAFRKREDRTLATAAVISYLIPLVLMTFAVISMQFIDSSEGPKPMTDAEIREQVAMFSDGTWAQIQGQRAMDAITQNWGFFPFYFAQILGLFLAGVLAWRRRLFEPERERHPVYRRCMIWGLGIGVTGNLTATILRWALDMQFFPPSMDTLWLFVLNTISVPSLSLGYVCAVILVCQNPVWRARLRRFGDIGRTALSNYLLQSVVGTLIFYSYGLGLFGLGPAVLLVFTVGIYALQAIVTPWWLARYRFGPVEWAWRSMTYGSAQPLRIAKE